MRKRFIAMFIASLLILPTVIITAEAISFTQNPFMNYDISRESMLKEAVSKENSVISAFTKRYSSVFPNGKTDGTEYIAKFKEEISLTEVYNIVKNYNFKLLADSESRIFSLIVNDLQEFMDKYGNTVVYIDKDAKREVCEVTNDPLLSDVWAYSNMDIYNAWDYTVGNKEVKVAVLDTGIDRRHEDFAGTAISSGYDIVTGRVGVTTDICGHGTKVSGLIAATANNGIGSAGVSYGVTIMPIRVSNTATSISSVKLVEGIRFAADAGAKIINMSCGGDAKVSAEQDAINYALNKGCIIVSASGNEGAVHGGSISYPASYDGVISVGSVGKTGVVSDFSQYNEYVDVVAPGENIIVMKYADGKSNYIYDKGTSFSSAYVSGIAALAASYLDENVRFGSEEFMALIKETGLVRNNRYGYGIINAKKILDLVNLPIITGVSDGKTYLESVTINFNRGTATLDGTPIQSGEVVFENGPHILRITYDTYTKVINFSVDNSPLTYEYIEESSYAAFTFERGFATLDGFPYASGQQITASGEHIFVLSGKYNNNISKKINLNFELPYVIGVDDNKTYNTPVCIRIIGEGNAVLDGNAFTGEKVVGTNGSHKLVVSNKTGSRTRTYNFTVNNSLFVGYKADLVNAKAIIDSENGYIILYSKDIQGVRVYDINNPTSYKRYLNVGRVTGYAFYGEYLLLYHSNKVTKLARSRVLNQSSPVDSVINMEENISACLLIGDELYYANEMTLKKYSLKTQKKSTAVQLNMNADKAFLSQSGDYIYLFDTQSDSKDISIFNIADGEITQADFPVSALGKEIVKGSAEFAVGNTIIGEDNLMRITENCSDIPLLMSENLLFTSKHIIDNKTNECLAVFREQVSDIFIDSGSTVYVIYSSGQIDIISNTADPVSDFKPAKFNAAPLEDIISAGSTENSPYTSFCSIFSGRKVTSFAAHGSLLYIICDGIPVLYILDSSTLIQVDKIPLLYIPRQVYVSDEKVYVSFMHESYIYSANVALAEFGDYINVGFNPQSLSVTDNKLVTIKEGMVVIADLNTAIVTETEIPASGVYAANDKIYTSSGSILNIYDFETFESIGSISAGVNIGSFIISGNYAFIGNRVFNLEDRELLNVVGDKIYAHRGNTVLTSRGVYSLSDGKYISNYKSTGKFFYLDNKFDYYTVAENKITLVKNAHGSDLTEFPEITGIEENANYNKGISIGYSYGIGYIDTEKIKSNTFYTKGGAHMFTLILSCGIKKEIEFSIVPAVNGIQIIGGDRSINIGEVINLRVRYLPEGSAPEEVRFETANTDIIKVNENGSVTGVKDGTAKVRAYTADGKFSDTCTITVNKLLIRFASDSAYKVDRNNLLVIGVPAGTSAGDVINAVATDENIEILDKDGNRIDGIIGTGMCLLLKNENGEELDKLTFSVWGDISGDGYISAEDYYCIIDILANMGSYETAFLKAADINKSGSVTNGDMSSLKEQLLYYGDNIEIKNTPPVNNRISACAVVKTNVFDNGKVAVTIQLEGALDVYAVSGKLKFNSDLLKYSKVNFHSWYSTIHSGNGFLSFLSCDKKKTGSTRSTKSLMTIEFTLKNGSLGKQLLFEMDDVIAVSSESSYTLAKTQTLRRVMQRTDSEFNIIINNAKHFNFAPDVYNYNVSVEADTAFLDIDAQYPKGSNVLISDNIIPDSNYLEVRVVYINPEGDSNTYLINVTREEEYIPDKNCYLSDLSVEGYSLSPEFDKNTTKYTLTVPYETEKLPLNYEPDSELCFAEAYNPTLVVGTNTVKITCISESGKMRIYTVSVTREAPKEVSDIDSDVSDNITEDNTDNTLYIVITVIAVLLAVAVFIVIRRKNAKKSSK